MSLADSLMAVLPSAHEFRMRLETPIFWSLTKQLGFTPQAAQQFVWHDARGHVVCDHESTIAARRDCVSSRIAAREKRPRHLALLFPDGEASA